MAQITRSTKIAGGTVLQANTLARAADVETDMLTLFNAHNNADTGTTKWQVVNTENATSTPLISNNSTGTNNILEARDNGTACVTIADGGTVTFAPGGTTKLVVNSSGGTFSNSATLAMGGAKITGLAQGTAATDAASFTQLKVIQWVSAVDATSFSTTSSTFQSTNLTASITPSSSSNKVLVIVTGAMEIDANTTIGFATITRASTDLDAGNGLASIRAGTSTGTFHFPLSMAFLDSPNTTSATAYTVKIKNLNNTATIKFPPSTNPQRCAIILAEVV